MVELELAGILISAGITIFSLGLLIVSLVSYKKFKNTKLFVISLIFIVLLVKGVLLSLGLFFGELSFLHSFLFSIYGCLFDLLILIILFVATLAR